MCQTVISAMEKNKLGRWMNGYRVMGKGLQFSKVVSKDATEKETFEQILVEMKEWVMLLCGGRKTASAKVLR